ncbi:MAG: hypothetical protein RXP92_00765 [Candidatus Micrarchaeota archaeon]
MTELLVRKEETSEELKLQRLERFLRKHGADDIIPKIQGMSLEKALEKVVRIGSDELVNELLNENPWVLEYESVAREIAEYRDKATEYMIDKYPGVLKYEFVAWDIAEHRSNDTIIHMIKKQPEVLKDESVAWTIANYRSNEEIMHIIDELIKMQPDMLGTERLTYNLAHTNRSEALTYILLRLGEIKPGDVESTTLQFSVMLRELDDDHKERVVKRIFLDRKSIGYRKELNSMGPLYLALLDMLDISKESAERLAKELSKAEGNVRKSLPMRGLAYALAHADGWILNPFINISTSMMDALTVFPAVYELRRMGILSDSEYWQISNSKDKEAELSKQLERKVWNTFNVKPKSEDAKRAMHDSIFIIDLFGLYTKYHEGSRPAEKVLVNAIKHYFEGGIQKFKEFKFGGHELAKEQLSDAYAIKEKLMNLDKQAVTYTSKRSIPYDSVKNDIDNFLSHKDELLRILDKIKEDAKFKLSEIARSAKSKKLASLLESKNLDGLTGSKFDSDDEKLKAIGIALIKLLKARESLDYINNIVNKLQEINGKPKVEQDIIMEEIAKEVAEWVDNKGLVPLKALKNHISKINKQQKQIGNGEQELGIAANAIGNAISIVYILLNYSKTDGEATVTAQITFDPSKILTFGRYGSSGAGNCQNSNGSVTYNQTLMSMLGDANQFMIMFQKANDTTRPLGFMRVHLLKSNEGMIFFMEKPYTNEPDKSTAMKEAARMLAQKIKNETGFDCFTYGEVGDEIEELEVEVPRSYVQRYIDFARVLKGPESFKYKIGAKCLTSDPFFGLKR